MTKTINIGIVGCAMSEEVFRSSTVETNEQFDLKKILPGDQLGKGLIQSHYPEAEIVHDVESIVNDNGIDLVIVCTPKSHELEVVGEALQAGKHVRVI